MIRQRTVFVIRRVAFQAAHCCLLPVLCATVSLAQYRFDHWTTDNGLPSNLIWMIVQTRDGYLWLTTSQGLVRFDGERLTVYDKSTSPGITGNRFSVLHEDRAGNLWAGTEDGGVLRCRDGVFTNWSLKDGLPGIRVERIDEDSAGAIWIYTDGGVATWRDGQLAKVTPSPGANLKDFIWSKEEFYDRFRTGAWQRSTESWQRFSRGAWAQLPFPPQVKTPALLRYLLEDTRGRLWYGAGFRTRSVLRDRRTVADVSPARRTHAGVLSGSARAALGQQQGR
jgi:hypothetical protein